MKTLNTFLAFAGSALLCLSFIVGCSSETATPSTTAGTTPAKVKFDPVTEEEAQAFADQITESFEKNDAAAFQELLDINLVFDTASAGLGLPAETRSGFLKGFNQQGSLFGKLAGMVKGGGRYELLRVRKKEQGNYHALFRLLLPEAGGVNYHEYALIKQNGKVKAKDLFVFLSAENLSATFRRLLIPLASQQNRSLLERLTKSENEYVTNMQKISELTEALRNGQNEKAFRIFASFPTTLQRDKTLLLLKLQAAQKLEDPQQYQDTLAEFRELFPHDANVDFLSIDYYLLRSEPDKALKSIENVIASVGGDPYLDGLKANAYLEAGKLELAEKTALQVMEQESELFLVHGVLLAIYVEQKDHTKLLQALINFDKTFGVDISGITDEPEYADFVKSPQYKEWLEYLKSNK